MARKERDAQVMDILSSSGSTSIVLNTANAVWTTTFKLNDTEKVAVSYKNVNTDSSNVTVVFEQSFQAPSTEGAYDATYATPPGMSSIVASVTVRNTWAHVALFTGSTAFVPLPFGRFKIQGNLLNTENTVNIKVTKQVEG